MPLAVVAVTAIVVAAKVYAGRRAARQKVSGGRKALVLNLFDR
jgi:hypothetical protein